MAPNLTPKNITLRERLDLLSMPEPNSGCQLWLAGLMGNDYPRVSWDGGEHYAHRKAWEDEHGPIPPGIKVLHKCDVTICIRLDHLFLGTDADNAMDKARKMRTTTSLSREAVFAIRRDTRPASVVATTFAISAGTVSQIKRGHRFAWLTEPKA